MLSVGTTTTTIVNAAFLQEVKDANIHLWTNLRALRELRLGSAETRELSRRLVDMLGDLRDAVALQFSLEETYGFIEGAAHPARWAIGDAAIAKTQHRDLYLHLHELCEQVEEAQYRGTIGRDLREYLAAFEEFDIAFQAHEDLETELIRCGLGIQRIPPR
jgi:hypothetical protein